MILLTASSASFTWGISFGLAASECVQQQMQRIVVIVSRVSAFNSRHAAFLPMLKSCAVRVWTHSGTRQ